MIATLLRWLDPEATRRRNVRVLQALTRFAVPTLMLSAILSPIFAAQPASATTAKTPAAISRAHGYRPIVLNAFLAAFSTPEHRASSLADLARLPAPTPAATRKATPTATPKATPTASPLFPNPTLPPLTTHPATTAPSSPSSTAGHSASPSASASPSTPTIPDRRDARGAIILNPDPTATDPVLKACGPISPNNSKAYHDAWSKCVAHALARSIDSGGISLGPLNPCNWGPVGKLCNAVGNFVGGLWDFISDPAGQLTKGGVSFFKAVNEGMTKTTTINFNQAAFIEQYAVTMGIGTLVILAVMLYIQSARPTREKALAYPSLLTAFFSMIAVPAGFYLFNRLIDELVAPYTASGQAAFNGLFTRMETLTTNLRDFGPANNLIASVSIAALYLAVAAILWVELILRGSIIYALLMFYPVLAAGWLTPSQRNGMVPALRSLIHNYLNTAAGIFLTKWVIAVMLATAGALSGGDASARLSALGLVILTVLAPFAVMAFIPVVSGSAAHGISRSFRAAAARTGRSTARRLRTP